MKVLSLTVVLVALIGAGGASSPPPAIVNVIAIHALQENRAQKHVEPGLEKVRSFIADIELDTFRKVCDENVSAPFATSTRVVLTAKHALLITPLGTGPRGQVRFSLVIQQPPKAGQDKPVNALSTTVLMPPNKPFRLRGLRWQGGELVVIVTLMR